ncbi:MAG: sulfatase-like hydrolase/transferase, partial [Verrucomicrobiota bacterium]
TGFMPNTSGLYSNSSNMLDSPLVQANATLPEYFSRHGYHTLSCGKIAHVHNTANGTDFGHWMYDEWVQSKGSGRVNPEHLVSREENIVWGKTMADTPNTARKGSPFRYGIISSETEKTKDYQISQWGAEQLQRDFEKPFFMALGFSKPHLPFFSPQEFWDLFPEEGDYLPEIKEDDLTDIFKEDGKPFRTVKSLDYLWLEEQGLLNEASRAYLACVAYIDHCFGVVLDALESSEHAANTIVVLWGDHGWHLGEKLRFRKAELWSEATRSPLMIRTPDMSGQKNCMRPVNLIDLYPTLVDYCGLPQKPNIDGRSIVPLLKEPAKKWQPTITVQQGGGASVHDEEWNLIVRDKGVRELYHLKNDPMEWTNLANDPAHQETWDRLVKYAQVPFAPLITDEKKSDKKGTVPDAIIRPAREKVELE